MHFLSVFTTNTIAFAEEVAVDAVDETVEAEEVVVDAYEPIDGQAHAADTIAEKQYAQVPDNWGINSDPANWPTAIKLVSVNEMYLGTVDVYHYYIVWSGTFSGGGAADHEVYEFNYDGYLTDEEIKDYMHDEKGYNVTTIDDRDVYKTGEHPMDPEWTVYNPISYFFNPVNFHLVDGQVVVPKEDKNHQDAQKSNDENVIYRKIPAGENTYILVRVKGDWTLGQDVDIFRYTDADHKSRNAEPENLNSRYNGNEPVVRYKGLKHSLEEKKGENDTFDVDAVLIKRENDKNTLVKGLSVKKVTFKNNVNASFPEEFVKAKHASFADDGSGTDYDNGWELTYKAGGVLDSAKYVGSEYEAQLTKTENANFKGQPSFQVTFNAKGDAKAYQKDIKKAEKANKGADTTFNFEIAQLNIGDYKQDTVTTAIDFEATADTLADAEKKFEAETNKYRDEYKAAYKALYPWLTDDQAKGIAKAHIDFTITGNKDKTYKGKITFNSVPMYVNKDIDAKGVSENNVPNNTPGIHENNIKLEVKNDDVKYLKFGKNGKVSAKLALYPSEQNIFTPNGTETYGGEDVGKREKPFSYVTTTPTAGGKADVILTSQTVTDSVFGEIPFAIAQGQNDLTGAMTMRIYTDAHGDDYIGYGHYKDANNFTVESLDD